VLAYCSSLFPFRVPFWTTGKIERSAEALRDCHNPNSFPPKIATPLQRCWGDLADKLAESGRNGIQLAITVGTSLLDLVVPNCGLYILENYMEGTSCVE
jgi:hypothetical protein